ncbi:hypothetical protein TorRG33x02_269600 [Trema orientale]|uniref:Uncharacterized protein n=1 Tax=Trema orientale TaxID=63057 RepID=A0A2P5CY51_TREOI|nr:hypothetical protein TorRG33x02_269600 [Trema orientale]
MQGKDDGAENSVSDEEHTTNGRVSGGIRGRESIANMLQITTLVKNQLKKNDEDSESSLTIAKHHVEMAH